MENFKTSNSIILKIWHGKVSAFLLGHPVLAYIILKRSHQGQTFSNNDRIFWRGPGKEFSEEALKRSGNAFTMKIALWFFFLDNNDNGENLNKNNASSSNTVIYRIQMLAPARQNHIVFAYDPNEKIICSLFGDARKNWLIRKISDSPHHTKLSGSKRVTWFRWNHKHLD